MCPRRDLAFFAPRMLSALCPLFVGVVQEKTTKCERLRGFLELEGNTTSVLLVPHCKDLSSLSQLRRRAFLVSVQSQFVGEKLLSSFCYMHKTHWSRPKFRFFSNALF